jgi:hypothetical protein
VQAASRTREQANSITASIRHYCATARARFQACDDFDAKRSFLRDYVERIVFNRGRITILGSLQLDGATPRLASLPHRGSDRRRFQETVGAGRAVWLVGTWEPTLKVSAFGVNLP